MFNGERVRRQGVWGHEEGHLWANVPREKGRFSQGVGLMKKKQGNMAATAAETTQGIQRIGLSARAT